MHGSAVRASADFDGRLRFAVVALGSNLGVRAGTLRAATDALEARGNTVLARSSFYETEPVGYENQPDFLNATVMVGVPECASPEDFLAQLLSIEAQFGRERPFPNAPRTLDLDLIFFENETRDTPFLSLPHPRWRERDFVKIPLREMFLSLGDRIPDCFRRVAAEICSTI